MSMSPIKFLLSSSLLTLITATHALGAAPAVVIDAQQTIGVNFSSPQSVAASPNGTVYIADLNNNQIVQVIPHLPGASTQSNVYTGPSGVSAPLAVAVDGVGDLYIADLPSPGVTSRIIEVMADGQGKLTQNVKQIYLGGLLTFPVSLAIDNAGTVFVGDAVLASIYAIPFNGTPRQVNLTGLPSTFYPAALAKDASGDLFMADGTATDAAVYVAPATGGAIRPVLTGSFDIDQPTGLALDYYGNLFIASYLGNDNGDFAGEEIVEVPSPSATTPSTPWIIPTSNLDLSGGIAVDLSGNLDVAGSGSGENNNGLVTQLNVSNPVNLGATNVFAKGPGITFNFAFNAPAKFTGFRTVTAGDAGTKSDVVKVSGGTCASQSLKGVTAYAPYICAQTFEAQPQYVGMRSSAIQVKGAGAAILASIPVYALGDAAAQIAYPLDVTTTELGLVQPQGVAISGFDQTVYIADLSGGKVYSVGGLSGASATPVFTGAPGSATQLSAPSAVAINGEGDLYIADFNLGQVIVVPTTTGIAPFVLNTGGLLQHPIALTVDFLGNLYIGDAGPEGDNAGSSNPGYLVVVPHNSPAFKAQIPGVAVIFPQAIAISPINGNVVIGDGGDIATGIGQIVELPSNGSAASVLTVDAPNVPTDPSGLTFDAAGNLYVLDGNLGTITVVSSTGAAALLPLASTTAFSAPSALASSAGGQSLVVANLGGGSANSLLYLNGNSATLTYGDQVLHNGGEPQAVTVTNIGNQTLTLNNNFYKPKSLPGFALAGGNTCKANDNLTLASPACTLSFAFDPNKVGAFNQTLTIQSNAYNTGVPVIHLTGTGTAKVKPAPGRKLEAAVPNATGRKSFAAASQMKKP
jgi:sugar lactone lactonase YvrE